MFTLNIYSTNSQTSLGLVFLPSNSLRPFSNSLALTQSPDIFSASSQEPILCVGTPSGPAGFCTVCRKTLFSRSANCWFSGLQHTCISVPLCCWVMAQCTVTLHTHPLIRHVCFMQHFIKICGPCKHQICGGNMRKSLSYILASVSCRQRWPAPTTLALTTLLG